ncbi:MAG: head decoration protein [Treponema sp.]|jgi:hypothetical protein|nr:head decoration protein [Treponema sp.]
MPNPSGTFTPDNLLGGAFPRVTGTGTIVSGAGALVRGTVLGQITSGGKLKTVNSANTDGSQTPYAVLAEDADASSSDVQAAVFLTGEFDENRLVFGGSDTVATHRKALRALSVFPKPALPA